MNITDKQFKNLLECCLNFEAEDKAYWDHYRNKNRDDHYCMGGFHWHLARLLSAIRAVKPLVEEELIQEEGGMDESF